MTLMPSNSNDSFGDPSFAIANAFREASDEDTRQVLNAMAHPTRRSSLTFYLVPCSWMVICLPFLSSQTDMRPTVKIENAPLLISCEVSDEDQDESNASGPREKRRSNRLRADIKHQIDFYCVGANVWGLVSEKFGYDIELGYKVVEDQQHRSLAIDLGNQKVPIPVTGWFDYRSSPSIHADIVSDDDDDLFPGPSESSLHPVPQPQDDTMAASSTAIIVLPAAPESPISVLKDGDMEVDKPARNSTLKRKRYGSGLANLGNTCFMNSTLQCLAHTEPLRRYFCSGAYRDDLNRNNPLGTGGELATTFAELLCEMWGSRETSTPSFNGVVYPRTFKYTLGKHAEQFLGYDQHDSQELATYLLDALHEDTNRVTKKPYVEKPEQGEDEPDYTAAMKAWDSHRQREDSRVLESFMGQVKSRVQCPTDGCGRVSTTFDPFMYLSVPIPGTSDRILKVTLVPLIGARREFHVTVPKTGTILTLQKKVVEQWQKLGFDVIDLKDLVVVDVWNNEVYNVFQQSDDLDKIRDSDVTFIFELTPSSQLKELEVSQSNIILPEKRRRQNRIKSSLEELASFNQDENWKKVIEKHISKVGRLSMLFNPNRATKESLNRFYEQLGDFLDECYEALESAASQYETDKDDEDDSRFGPSGFTNQLEELQRRSIENVCCRSTVFSRVSGVEDIAALTFAEGKLRAFIVDLVRSQDEKDREGIVINVIFNRKESSIGIHRNRSDRYVTTPLCLRVEANMTVYGLRELLGRRLPFRDLTPLPKERAALETDLMEASTENETIPFTSANCSDFSTVNQQDDCGLFAMRQVPFACVDQRISTPSFRTAFSAPDKVGMLEDVDDSLSDSQSVSMAEKDSFAEQITLKEAIGNGGTVSLHFPSSLFDKYFDLEKYEETEYMASSDAMSTKQNKMVLSVSQCIDKYCQMEQLEETEMWYCNKCKEHVRAWKQFHLYRTPPILIIHLKRFHYSASTHRRDKIDSFIDFPLVGLDLTADVMHWNEDEKPVYDCYAVSNHYGGLGGGHYTAYALSDDGTWCHYDDSRVTTNVSPSDVVSKAAYVLYYKRRGIDLSTPEVEEAGPRIVQDSAEKALHEDATLVRVDSMDIDDRALGSGSPISSNTSTSAMAGMSPQDDDFDFEKTEYESDHLPADED